MEPRCIGCGKRPEDIEEYIEAAAEEEITPSAYVQANEGTYNKTNGHFACTLCWVEMGAPSLPWPRTWVAP